MTIQDFISKETEILPAPKVAIRLNNLIRSSPFSEEVIKVVKNDTALSARILRVCNTPVFRGREAIVSVEDAVSRLGFENILRIVWQLSVGAKMADSLPLYGMAIGTFWRHSLTVALSAEELARTLHLQAADVSVGFTAGLLHDIGKFLINSLLMSRGMVLNDYQPGATIAVVDAEQNQLGLNHAQVGAALLRYWDLPDILVEAVSSHHTPEASSQPKMAGIVHLADICSHTMGASYGWGDISIPLVGQSMATLGIESADLEKVIANVRMRADEIEVFMMM